MTFKNTRTKYSPFVCALDTSYKPSSSASYWSSASADSDLWWRVQPSCSDNIIRRILCLADWSGILSAWNWELNTNHMQPEQCKIHARWRRFGCRSANPIGWIRWYFMARIEYRLRDDRLGKGDNRFECKTLCAGTISLLCYENWVVHSGWWWKGSRFQGPSAFQTPTQGMIICKRSCLLPFYPHSKSIL